MFERVAEGSVWVRPAYCPNHHPQVSGGAGRVEPPTRPVTGSDAATTSANSRQFWFN